MIDTVIRYYYNKARSYDDPDHNLAIGLSLSQKLINPTYELMDEDMERLVAIEIDRLKEEGIIE